MSMCAYVKLYQFNSDKKILRAYENINVNYMKVCMDLESWDDDLSDFEFNFPSKEFDAPEIETIGYASPELFEEMKKKLETQTDKTYGKITDIGEDYIRVDDNYSLYNEEENRFINLTDAKKRNIPDEWKKIKRETYLGNKKWVNITTLSEAFDKKEKELEESLERLKKLNSFKESIEYYKLNDDARENLFNDVISEEENRDTLKLKMHALAKLEGLLDGFHEKNEEDFNEITVGLLYLC